MIRAGAEGDIAAFKAVSRSIIEEERQKQHHLLANDLERLLYGTQVDDSSNVRRLHKGCELPTNKDNGLALLEERAVVREEKDIILSDATQTLLSEIIHEHNRADVLRSYGLRPAQKLLFCGPSGCGKTLAAEVIAPWSSCGWIPLFHPSLERQPPICARCSITSHSTRSLLCSTNSTLWQRIVATRRIMVNSNAP
jgi:SpoVK/Ycf46/Vps4 family AAA+-type ATPase